MKIRITKRTKRIIAVYIAVLVILYVVAFQIPHATGALETTQVLKNGTLEVSCESMGYVVKDEAVCTASRTGTLKYKVEDGTVVKKGTRIARIKKAEQTDQGEPEISGKYEDYLARLKGYKLLKQRNKSPISGVFSTSIDGYEKFFCIDNLDGITKEKAEEVSPSQLQLDREQVVKGEPIYKISSDDTWYIVTWVERADARKFEENQSVRITIGESTMDASVYEIKREGEMYRIVYYLNVYYEDFCTARIVDINVVQSNTVGLIVDNECIIKKDGVKGVYVKTKDGDTYFKPIKVKITDGKQSVIYESIYVNDKYEQVETVSVYQEVLRDPAEAREKEMSEE